MMRKSKKEDTDIQNLTRRFTSSFSKYALLITIVSTIVVGFYYHRWSDDKIIIHDVTGYYAYLPATFIYHDLNFGFKKDAPEYVFYKLYTKTTTVNRQVIKMTMGNAICWLPFFALAHGYASLSPEYAADGYTVPYAFMLFVAAIFYLSLGLIYLRKLLLKYFMDTAVAVVLLIVVLATNLLYYVAIEPGMSHVLSFTLVILFIYHATNWLQQPKFASSVYLGLFLGLITLIRPSNLVVVLFPVLVFLFRDQEVSDKIRFIRINIINILIIGVFTVLVFVPQLIYWKYFTGDWLFYSYGQEGFFFNNPHIFKGLFSYRKGWFVYTPVMFLAIPGLIILRRYIKNYALPILIFSLINFYIIFSWWTWWYGGSFGARPIIDTYGIYAIALAAFLDFIFHKKIWKRILLGLILGFLVFLNFFQTYQYTTSLLHYDSMTRKAYWAVFLKTRFPKNYDKLIKTPDYDAAIAGKKEYQDKDTKQ